jgi:hypothetical protein
MALTAAAAAAAAEWSAQFLWIWFAEMRFVASHHVSLVKLAEHVTLLKAAAATPRRAKFPSPAIRSGGRENYSPPSTRIWVTFIHETFVDSLQRTWALFCAFCEGSLHVSRYGYTAEGPAGLFCKVQLFI